LCLKSSTGGVVNKISQGFRNSPRVVYVQQTEKIEEIEMSVYFVVQEEVNDQDGLERYMKAASASSLGRGRAIIVDNNVTSVEGDWHGSRLVVLEFDDDEAFREWYDSPEYQEALPLRLSSTDSRAVLAKGLS
jgi:uncharacterized protein (DUF1330 family)|tara:strand:+ start:4847 stop:5245 length:399 start_codon:yes stop_codon:yes gene_type:complete